MARVRTTRSFLQGCACIAAFVVWLYYFLPTLSPNPSPFEAPGLLVVQDDTDTKTDHTSIYKLDAPSSHHDSSLRPAKPVSPTPEAQETYTTTQVHAIDTLIEEANNQFQRILEKQVSDIHDAAEAYRRRRGRHPPPGFELWYEYAKDNGAVIVEDFWDQIYNDLEPFWAVDASIIRTHSRKLGMTVVVENGTAQADTDWFWHVIWAKMIDEVADRLPDMVIPLNPMDEPRIMVSWEKMTEMISAARGQRKYLLPAEETSSHITGWGLGPSAKDKDVEVPDITWRDAAPYSYARMACPPTSAVRRHTEAISPRTLTECLERYQPRQEPPDPDLITYIEPSFVSNYSEATNLCSESAIAYYHGALTDPLTAKTSTELLPMFGGSKLAHVNNEILLPEPMYWNEEERFTESDTFSWSEKSDRVIWRGTATGGWNKPNTWLRFHRHRFVALTNGTKYEASGQGLFDDMFSPLWHLAAISRLKQSIQTRLGSWLSKLTDIAFTDLFCDTHNDQREPGTPYGECWYTSPHYRVVPSMKLSSQYRSKYLPDIDGNSFSGRYRSFLLSNSLPIKATLYREWHDSRLMAWKHFVPMNNRFDDFYRLMEYFIGCPEEVCEEEPIEGHDAQAEKIATAGREWAEKVLRKVDMQIYALRLLLEWARVTDDDRLRLAWTGDLT